MSATPAATETSPKRDHLEASVLLCALYSDLFSYPLTVEELFRYLPRIRTDRKDFDASLDGLCHDGLLTRHDDWICLAGREAVIEQRQERARLAASRWQAARGFGRWLRHVPFLRMVAVCGSHAVENADENGDIDLFLITAPERLWLVQASTMVLRRMGQWRFGVEICPNFLLDTTALSLRARNLYTARESVQAVPLWGRETYAEFLAQNRWIEELLPQIDLANPTETPALADRRRFLGRDRASIIARLFERLLGGRLGTLLDHAIHRTLLVYYRLRLRRHGWNREQIERAYGRHRQRVIRGGYAGAVAQAFAARLRERDLDQGSTRELAWQLFPSLAEADPLYTDLMASRYGANP